MSVDSSNIGYFGEAQGGFLARPGGHAPSSLLQVQWVFTHKRSGGSVENHGVVDVVVTGGVIDEHAQVNHERTVREGGEVAFPAFRIQENGFIFDGLVVGFAVGAT